MNFSRERGAAGEVSALPVDAAIFREFRNMNFASGATAKRCSASALTAKRFEDTLAHLHFVVPNEAFARTHSVVVNTARRNTVVSH